MPQPKKSTAYSQESFGFQESASGEERTARVRQVFESVAPRYDLMNDLMSFGVHRLWKADFVRRVDPKPGEKILDLAGGTGDIAFLMARTQAQSRLRGASETSGPQSSRAQITVCDINSEMLKAGQARATDKGFHGKIEWVEGNAEKLPFENASFDAVTIAFGLRNVTHISKALAEALRVLKIGGRFYCLEFSRPALPFLEKIYDRYSFSVLPWLGKKVAGDAASYQYLAESIRAFPEQEKLAALMRDAGFEAVRFRNLSLGIAAVHSGWKS